jgi:hypothetical protein
VTRAKVTQIIEITRMNLDLDLDVDLDSREQAAVSQSVRLQLLALKRRV